MGEDGTFTAPSSTTPPVCINVHRYHALADTPLAYPPQRHCRSTASCSSRSASPPDRCRLRYTPPAAMAPQATPPRPPPRVGVQDMAPPGGYASIGVARNVPKSVGPRASLLMLAGALVMGGGLYRVGNFNVYRRYVAPPGGGPWGSLGVLLV